MIRPFTILAASGAGCTGGRLVLRILDSIAERAELLCRGTLSRKIVYDRDDGRLALGWPALRRVRCRS
eukprot:4637988-Heterocapsa_arctica.AAC.1